MIDYKVLKWWFIELTAYRAKNVTFETLNTILSWHGTAQEHMACQCQWHGIVILRKKFILKVSLLRANKNHVQLCFIITRTNSALKSLKSTACVNRISFCPMAVHWANALQCCIKCTNCAAIGRHSFVHCNICCLIHQKKVKRKIVINVQLQIFVISLWQNDDYVIWWVQVTKPKCTWMIICQS